MQALRINKAEYETRLAGRIRAAHVKIHGCQNWGDTWTKREKALTRNERVEMVTTTYDGCQHHDVGIPRD